MSEELKDVKSTTCKSNVSKRSTESGKDKYLLEFKIKGGNELNNEPDHFFTRRAQAGVGLQVLAFHLGSLRERGSTDQHEVARG